MIYIRGHHSDYDHWSAAGNPAGPGTTCCRISSVLNTTNAALIHGMARVDHSM